MPVRTKVTIGGKSVTVLGSGSKADICRALLVEGYAVSQISRAVPMAYSQALTIANKENVLYGSEGQHSTPRPGRPAEIRRSTADKRRESSTPPARRVEAPRSTSAPASAAEARRTAQQLKTAPTVQGGYEGSRQQAAGIGKLRTPGHQAADVEVGPCINCRHDLILRHANGPTKSGMWFICHINITSDEYFATVQFCQAVPELLRP